MDGILFEVEVLLDWPRLPAVVFARQLEPREFAVSDASRLGGCAIEPYVTRPHALLPDGTPRIDLFAFALHTREDIQKFQVGQRVLLDAPP